MIEKFTFASHVIYLEGEGLEVYASTTGFHIPKEVAKKLAKDILDYYESEDAE